MVGRIPLRAPANRPQRAQTRASAYQYNKMFAPRYRLEQTIKKIAFFVEPNFRLAANICRLIPAAGI
jgi:hypothetical protein